MANLKSQFTADFPLTPGVPTADVITKGIVADYLYLQ